MYTHPSSTVYTHGALFVAPERQWCLGDQITTATRCSKRLTTQRAPTSHVLTPVPNAYLVLLPKKTRIRTIDA